VRFFLGTHRPGWLGRLDVPLFVSVRTLRRERPGGRAVAPWALDSGGFTELLKGESGRARFVTPAAVYAEEAARFAERVGGLAWASPQDWMCEPQMIDGGPLPGGIVAPVAEHQERTVQSVLDLRALAPMVPFAPVLQGWALDDYVRCVELYEQAGFDLAAEPVVGVGSVCRAAGHGRDRDDHAGAGGGRAAVAWVRREDLGPAGVRGSARVGGLDGVVAGRAACAAVAGVRGCAAGVRGGPVGGGLAAAASWPVLELSAVCGAVARFASGARPATRARVTGYDPSCI
jgi:hypothetical protein